VQVSDVLDNKVDIVVVVLQVQLCFQELDRLFLIIMVFCCYTEVYFIWNIRYNVRSLHLWEKLDIHIIWIC